MSESLTYEKAGVNIDVADATKTEMKKSLSTQSSRVLNTLGAFASLVDFSFKDIQQPVMVMKMEEPGSKQLLAAQHGRLPEVGNDLINHLINDTIMMGARPVAIQDTIVCGELDKDTVVALVDTMTKACQAEGCDLVGGETSEQPRVIPNGSYILSAACVGVVDKTKIIDGQNIKEGDVVLGIASNGVHTNGYTLIRSLLEDQPNLADKKIGDETFLDQVLKPHLCYNSPLQDIFKNSTVNGLAHITGGGVVDNTGRILSRSLNIDIDLSKIDVLPVFKEIAKAGSVPHDDMLRTFNMGIGLILVCSSDEVPAITDTFLKSGFSAYPIGEVVSGSGQVTVQNKLHIG